MGKVQIRFTEIDLKNLEMAYSDILKSRRAKKPENRVRALAKADSIYRAMQILKTERGL